MKFLCDVHISLKLSKQIEQLGFESEHVNNILKGSTTKDEDIASYVDANDQILITKDQDFRNSYFLSHQPKKLIKINLGNISNPDLMEIFEKNMNRIVQLNEQNETFMIEVNEDSMWMITK